ncbi:MAG: L-histidine N(alpha)-methyltransferase [bacterium]|nr:L-histidine N(alpha)-methyltransferase [bacterium]
MITSTSHWRSEILTGLQKPQKELPSKFLYDERGSQLFDRICETPEYYITRVETEIMENAAEEIASLIGSQVLLIEYGNGSSNKTQILLEHIRELSGYIPIDISLESLMSAASKLATIYPWLKIYPVWADFTDYFNLPPACDSLPLRLAYLPGSTIGNFYPEDAVAFMKRIAQVVRLGGILIIGMDLEKENRILHLAYNDEAGVTAEFNKNILVHINHEFGSDFCVNRFRHQAFYNKTLRRVEMYLVSLTNQLVNVCGTEYRIQENESILTEVSYKYSAEEFQGLVLRAGFTTLRVWTDPLQLFSVYYLIAHN